MQSLPFDLPKFEPGWVWLAGAGPGDAGLLTLHALNALRQADVLVYDALVGQVILELVSPDCELEYAGKRGGKPSAKQRDISLRLVELAEQGKRVLRLKGGDPFVFGRGGEEALCLAKAGIPFRIIPGISAGIGGLAYAGIPVTYRDFNSAVTFLTGHGMAGEVPERHNWDAIAQGSPVIVMYMATKYLGEIAARLMRNGRSAEEPVAVITQASLPDQRVLETKLGTCSEDVEKHGIEPPAIIVVGEVVSLRKFLKWMD
ncbi:MAG: uroporphyrinogen-III C-methyltransferase [SAR324 cluster bacterium]|jgi:uroporphyrin-III C-methyltransferase|nr:uroporphyrinogen-III C-methyltransferase [SAR324 cluster bacterium]MCH2266051.1 uroporphyrinogen-III C-methyltransferase [SAR324 cluster bacterium]MCH2270905.1 uroporphyrinogen-III C-methyltransferase [SAR324 cluster bacterium]